MPVEDPKPKVDRLAVALRVGVFLFLAFTGTVLFPRLLNWAPNMYFVAAALGAIGIGEALPGGQAITAR